MSDVQEADVELAEQEQSPADGSSMTLFGTQDPEGVIEQAERVSKPLAQAIEDRDLISNIAGNDHVEIEGWTMLGSMLGVFPVTKWTDYVEYGDAEGFECKVNAVTRDGEVVGSAEAMCLNDEPNWRDATLQELRSMAQTRASSKALRMPLGFVIELAGYETTPAEEMDNVEKRKSTKSNTSSPGGSSNKQHTYPFSGPDGKDLKDKPLSEVPDEDLEWLVNEYLTGDKLEGDFGDKNKELKAAAQEELASRNDESGDEKTPVDELEDEKEDLKARIFEVSKDVNWPDDMDRGYIEVIKATLESNSVDSDLGYDKAALQDVLDYLSECLADNAQPRLDEGELPISPL